MKRAFLLLGLTLSCSSTPGTPDMGSGGVTAAGGTEPSSGGTGQPATGGTTPSAGGESTGSGGTSVGGSGGIGSGGIGSGGGAAVALGMNDVTILLPLPLSSDEPVLLRAFDSADDGEELVPYELVERLGDDPVGSESFILPNTYDRLHVVGVRFDLCDHQTPGPCPTSGDASLRLVFQRLDDGGGAEDTGFHAFYTILEAEIPAAIQALSELSLLRTGPAEPLGPSASLSEDNPAYAEKLRLFVRAYGGASRLVRLTMNTQSFGSEQFKWILRGLEKQGSDFVDQTITGTSENIQTVTLQSEAFFEAEPASDFPQGLALALDGVAFQAAEEADQLAALGAFAAIDNPLDNAPDTVACVACHTSTVALAMRSEDLGVDLLSLPGRYETPFDVSVAEGKSQTTEFTLRAFGYLNYDPMISQRVANDTALVLEDIALRSQ